LEPHRARIVASVFAKQLTSQQSPPSQPHSAELAAPLLHLPLPSTKPEALHTASVGLPVGLAVGDKLGAELGRREGIFVGTRVGAVDGRTVGNRVGEREG
jgi:hypothetical protein